MKLRSNAVVLVFDKHGAAALPQFTLAHALNDLCCARNWRSKHRGDRMKWLELRLAKRTTTCEAGNAAWVTLKRHRPVDLFLINGKRCCDCCLEQAVAQADAHISREQAYQVFCRGWRAAIKRLHEEIVPVLPRCGGDRRKQRRDLA